MLQRLAHWFRPSAQTARMHHRYREIVTQARDPRLYTECGIPDTLDGRFEALVLHLFLEGERLKRAGEPADNLRQLQELFFADMDRSLREMGVSDTGVGKRVKQMASAFYGRVAAYEQAWGDPAAFETALQRNVYATCEKPPMPEMVNKLYAYLTASLAGSQPQA